MNSPHKINELTSILKEELSGNKARMTLLACLVLAVLKVRSVNFKRLATAYHNGALLSSRLRRVQRFFREVEIPEALYCRLLSRMLPVEAPYRLSLDRTNWKLGALNINILFLCVIYKGVGLPLLWTVLGDKRGNSSQEERISLLDRFIKYFGTGKIEYLTADREFVGKDWMGYLCAHRLRFYIRVRNNMHFTLPCGKRVKAFWLLLAQPLNQVYFHPKIVRLNGVSVYFSGVKHLNAEGKIDYLILVSFNKAELSLELYKHRWQIETMFRAFKSSGFNLESTHITDKDRLSNLIKVLSIAFVWAYATGIYLHQNVKAIPVKKHGRRAESFFTYGLDKLAEAFINNIRKDIKLALSLFLSCT